MTAGLTRSRPSPESGRSSGGGNWLENGGPSTGFSAHRARAAGARRIEPPEHRSGLRRVRLCARSAVRRIHFGPLLIGSSPVPRASARMDPPNPPVSGARGRIVVEVQILSSAQLDSFASLLRSWHAKAIRRNSNFYCISKARARQGSNPWQFWQSWLTLHAMARQRPSGLFHALIRVGRQAGEIREVFPLAATLTTA